MGFQPRFDRIENDILMVTNPLFGDYDKVAREIRRRIKLAVWAYAYEVYNDSLVSDDEFDRECMLVDVRIDTSRPDLDEWFRQNFQAHTGQWIHKHPELAQIEALYHEKYKKGNVL